jgi:hypothetical protein
MIEHNSTRHAAETMRTALTRIEELVAEREGRGDDLTRAIWPEELAAILDDPYTPSAAEAFVCPAHGPHPHLAVAGRCLDCPECFPETAD